MNRNQAKALLPIIQAYAEGKVIQIQHIDGTWQDAKYLNPGRGLIYRITPEPTYRPFKDAEECWAEMQKHQPFGWVKHNKDGDRSLITTVIGGKGKVCFDESNEWCFDRIMEYYTFADGVPFGVKVEE